MKYFAIIVDLLSKNPLVAFTTLLLIALSFLYNDIRNFLTSQTEVIQSVSIELRENSLRLKRLEEYHLQCLQMYKELEENQRRINKDR